MPAGGMSDYLAKPVDPHELANVLEKWLTARETNHATEAEPVAAPEETGNQTKSVKAGSS